MAFAGVGLEFVYTGMVVTDSQMFGVGHNIRRWAEGIANNYAIAVFEEAPLNKRPNKSFGTPGELKIGLSTGVERVGVRHLLTTCTSKARYTKWVAGGTAGNGAGRIYAKGKPFGLPTNPQGTGPRHSVQGQRRNMFFERAFIRTAARHPSLQGSIRNFGSVQL